MKKYKYIVVFCCQIIIYLQLTRPIDTAEASTVLTNKGDFVAELQSGCLTDENPHEFYKLGFHFALHHRLWVNL